MAFTWDITPHEGRGAIANGLADCAACNPGFEFCDCWRQDESRASVKRTGVDVFEAIFSFETKVGRGLGVVRLLACEPDKAFALMTSLKELKGHEEPTFDAAPSGEAYSRNFGGETGLTCARSRQAYADRDRLS